MFCYNIKILNLLDVDECTADYKLIKIFGVIYDSSVADSKI